MPGSPNSNAVESMRRGGGQTGRGPVPTLRFERRAWASGKLIVAGVDEAGRGAWAGPLVAAAVILPDDPRARARITRAINRTGTRLRDSKLLTPDQRQRVREALRQFELPHAICEVSVEEIDAIGLGPANRAALCRAVAALWPRPEHALVDAYRLDDLACSHDAIIRGDNISQSIALASIIAKLQRDELMMTLDGGCPEYGFAAHKGYGTAEHARALALHGVSPHHRRSFAPIARLLDEHDRA